MKKLSSHVHIRKEIAIIGGWQYVAYWRGTSNRVCYTNGLPVKMREHVKDLRFDLLNNEMERGVIAYQVPERTTC